MSWFKNLDNKLIKSRPITWILGLHIFVPLILIEGLVLFAIGYFHGFDTEIQRDEKSLYGLISLLATMLSIAFIVIYFIRQVRFNSKRIHHQLPFKRFMSFFFAFYMIMLGLSMLPYAANYGAFTKAYQETRELDAKVGHELQEWQYWELDHPEDNTMLLYYVKYKKSSFFCAKWVFILNYSLLALALAMMLLGICSTSIKDFGWSMLINTLIPIAFGILLAISGILGGLDGEGTMTILTIMTLIAIVVGLFAVPRHSNDRSRSFALSFYFYSPILILTYIMTAIDELDIDDWPVGMTYLIVLVVTLLFGVYAKRRAVNPL